MLVLVVFNVLMEDPVVEFDDLCIQVFHHHEFVLLSLARDRCRGTRVKHCSKTERFTRVVFLGLGKVGAAELFDASHNFLGSFDGGARNGDVIDVDFISRVISTIEIFV